MVTSLRSTQFLPASNPDALLAVFVADVDGVQGYRTKYENQKELLETSDDLAESDRRALMQWVAHLRTNDSDVESLGTIVGHVNCLGVKTRGFRLSKLMNDGIFETHGIETGGPDHSPELEQYTQCRTPLRGKTNARDVRPNSLHGGMRLDIRMKANKGVRNRCPRPDRPGVVG